MDAYGLSKLANVLFTAELARRLPEGVTANCCHPGVAPRTALARDGRSLGTLVWTLFGLVGSVIPGVTDSPGEAAETPVYLARSPDVAGVTGAYSADCERRERSPAATVREHQRRLWEWSVARAAVDVPDCLAD